MTTIAERYRLERVLGRGGMGEVWLAEDVVLGRMVAAKRIGGGAASPEELARAQQEARVTAMLDHEHVVRVFDLVVDDDQQWLVMEYVESQNLSQLVRAAGPLDPTVAARLVVQASGALAAAHAAGIVHRDVKPSNLLVTPDGHVKLSDFGIARLETDMGITRTGLLVGSPGYLAPEVATGTSATPASDLWSLGATLFHAVEGHPPYETVDGNVVGTLYRIVNEPVPALTRAGWVGPLVQHLMRHDPAERWDAQRVTAYLDGALAQGPARGVPAPAAPVPVPVPAPAPQPSVAPAPEEATSVFAAPTPTEPPPSGSWFSGRLLYAGIAALVLLVVVAGTVAVLANRSGSGTPAAGSGRTPSASASVSPSATGPTSDGMLAFVRDYLATAPADPSTTFARLTPAYQQQSGGLKGYQGFWGTVASAQPSSLQADPQGMTVSYVVSYRLRNGRTSRDSVRLDLTYQGGTYLIAGEGR